MGIDSGIGMPKHTYSDKQADIENSIRRRTSDNDKPTTLKLRADTMERLRVFEMFNKTRWHYEAIDMMFASWVRTLSDDDFEKLTVLMRGMD